MLENKIMRDKIFAVFSILPCLVFAQNFEQTIQTRETLKTIQKNLDTYYQHTFDKEGNEDLIEKVHTSLSALANYKQLNNETRDEWLDLVFRSYNLTKRIENALNNPTNLAHPKLRPCGFLPVYPDDYVNPVDNLSNQMSCKLASLRHHIDEHHQQERIQMYANYIHQIYDMNSVFDKKRVMKSLNRYLSPDEAIYQKFHQLLNLAAP